MLRSGTSSSVKYKYCGHVSTVKFMPARFPSTTIGRLSESAMWTMCRRLDALFCFHMSNSISMARRSVWRAVRQDPSEEPTTQFHSRSVRNNPEKV